MIQTNICNGPVYFNCMPNYSVSLTDPLFLNSLILDVHLQGDEFERFTEQVAVMYKLYFKLMSSQMNPKFKMIGSPIQEETVLLQIEAEQSRTFVPKRLKWNEITIPEEFKIENPQTPRDIERTEISDIIEEEDGTILIRFNSVRERPSTSFRYVEPSRNSCSEYSFQQPIKVFHKSPLPEVNQENYSPTSSQMRPDFIGEINMIKKPFISDSFRLMKEFREESKQFDWFSRLHRTYQEQLINKWLTDIEEHEINFNFEI